MALFFDVLLDDFICHVAATDAEVAARPDVAPSEFLSQMRELMHQLVRTLPLEHLQQSANSQAWRHAHEQVNVVARHVTFHDGDFVRTTDFADQLSNSCPDFPTHHWVTVLRDPDDVQVDAENCMRAVPIFCHGAQFIMGRKTC